MHARLAAARALVPAVRLHACFIASLVATSMAAHANAAAGAEPIRAPAQSGPVLTLADQPLRLIRGATLYRAAAGVAVQRDDILETAGGNAGAQLEAGLDAIVALGPDTRVLVTNLAADGKSGVGLALLRGWVKVAVGSGRRALVATPGLQVTLAGGSAIVRSQDGRDAVFAEDGAQQAAKVDGKGKAGAPLRLAPEQYADTDPAKAQPMAGRPPPAFVAAMPLAFRDRLVRAPAVPNAGKVALVKERDVDFADVEAWLAAPLPARRGFAARFRPRLADPAFRRQVERVFGRSAEWQAVLQPPRPAKPAQPASTLF